MSKNKIPGWMVCAGLLAMALGLPVAAVEPEALCADCHGKEGISTESDVPTIAGLSEQYLLDSMDAYRNKTRPCPENKWRAGDTKRAATTMCKVATDLSPPDTAKIAKKFAGIKFVAAKQKFDAAKAATGKKVHDTACEKCHSEGGSLAEDDAGILAGQWMGYMKMTFDDYRKGTREQPVKMKVKLDPLKPEQLDALLHYYASKQ